MIDYLLNCIVTKFFVPEKSVLNDYQSAYFRRKQDSVLFVYGKKRNKQTSSGWWFQPISKILVKLDQFPTVRGENKKYLKPPPSLFLWVGHENLKVSELVLAPSAKLPKQNLKIPWSNVFFFLSPTLRETWRSLSLWKGHLSIPIRSQKWAVALSITLHAQFTHFRRRNLRAMGAPRTPWAFTTRHRYGASFPTANPLAFRWLAGSVFGQRYAIELRR